MALGATGAGIGVRLEEAGELPEEEATRLVAELGKALESSCARAVAIDDTMWSTCPPDQRCVDQVRARTRFDDVVLLRVFGSLTIARVIADRFLPGATEPARHELDVPRG